MFNIQDAVAAAAAQAPDMTQAKKGGGDYVPPAAGPVRLRLISYIELGIHAVKGNAAKGIKDKDNDLVTMQFELSGPKHPPHVDEKGVKFPQIITLSNMNLSLNEKAGFYKLFTKMNHTKEFTHMAQLLGKPFRGTITHNEVGEGADKKVFANLRDKDGSFLITAPFYEHMDPETQEIEYRPLAVDEPISKLKLFIWNAPVNLKEMWDTLFIDGRYDDKTDEKTGVVTPGTSKNRWQNTIRKAKNFAGSPIADIICDGDPDLGDDLPFTPDRSEADKQASADQKAGAAADPLAGY